MIINAIVLRFKKGRGQYNVRKLEKYLAFLKKQKGFIDGQVARSIDDPEGYVVVSRWENLKAHENMEKNMEKEKKINEDMMKIIGELEDPFRAGRYIVQKSGRDDEIIKFDKIQKHCRMCSFPLENKNDLCIYCGEREKLHTAIKEKLMSEKKFTKEEADDATKGMDR